MLKKSSLNSLIELVHGIKYDSIQIKIIYTERVSIFGFGGQSKGHKRAVFTSSVKNSVSRNTPDGAIRDEVIALAIAEERSAADGVLQATEFLTDEVNTAHKGPKGL